MSLRTLHEMAVAAGYHTYRHRSHVGDLWGWSCPTGRGGSHFKTQAEAWMEAEDVFKRELERTCALIDLFGDTLRAHALPAPHPR